MNLDKVRSVKTTCADCGLQIEEFLVGKGKFNIEICPRLFVVGSSTPIMA